MSVIRWLLVMLCGCALSGCAWTKQPFETGRIHADARAESAILLTVSFRDPVDGTQLPSIFAPIVAPLEWINLGLLWKTTAALDDGRDGQFGIELDQFPLFLFAGQIVPTFWVGARQAVVADDVAPSLVGARLLLRPAFFCWACKDGRVEVITGLELRYTQSLGANAVQGVGSVYVRGEIFAYSGWSTTNTPDTRRGPFNRRGTTMGYTAGGYLGAVLEGEESRMFVRAHAAYIESLKIGRFEPGWVRIAEMGYMAIARSEADEAR